jgi:hypothetical protein
VWLACVKFNFGNLGVMGWMHDASDASHKLYRVRVKKESLNWIYGDLEGYEGLLLD